MTNWFDNMKNLGNLMGQAKEMRAKMEQIQEQLARMTVEADAGAGAVTAVVNGKLELISIRMDRPLLATLVGSGSEADQAMVEELIAAAVNAALGKAKELVRTEMSKLTGGMDLGGMGLDKLLGG